MERRSYVALAFPESPGGPTLFGGRLCHRSARYGSPALAESWLGSVLRGNREAGRPCRGEVHEVAAYPEIFVHCGTDPQALHYPCPACGVKLRTP